PSLPGALYDVGPAYDPGGHRGRVVHRAERGLDHELRPGRAPRGRRGNVGDSLQRRLPGQSRAGLRDHGLEDALARHAGDLRRPPDPTGPSGNRLVHGRVPSDLRRHRRDQSIRGDSRRRSPEPRHRARFERCKGLKAADVLSSLSMVLYAKDIVEPEFLSMRPQTTLLEADKGIRRVLVQRDGKVIGVIRAQTIARRMRDYLDSISAQIARAQLPLF